MDTNAPIELSDDENDLSKMPPPAFVPPVKAVKEKKPPTEKKIRATRSKQSKRTKVFNVPLKKLSWTSIANTLFGVLFRLNKSKCQKVKMKCRPQAR